jgi:hypothetical protein
VGAKILKFEGVLFEYIFSTTIHVHLNSPVAGTGKSAMESVQSFLPFPYLWGVLFKNLNDATLSSLGNLHDMQIEAVISKNLFVNIAVTMHYIKNNFSVYPHVVRVKELD